MPSQGQQVTTKDSPGAASYQVTGLKDGQYCGGAAVNVVFLSASQATSSAPAADHQRSGRDVLVGSEPHCGADHDRAVDDRGQLPGAVADGW